MLFKVPGILQNEDKTSSDSVLGLVLANPSGGFLLGII